MQKYFFHSFIIAFSIGVAFQTLITFSWPILVVLVVIAAGLVAVRRKEREASFAPHLLPLALIIGCFALGALRTEMVSREFGHSPFEQEIGNKIELSGVVVREPDVREKSTHLYVEVEGELLLVTTDRYSALVYGDEVLVSGKVERPESFTSELGREFNYPGYLLARGVEFKIPYAAVEVLSDGNGNPIISFLLKLKQHLMSGIERVISEPQAGLGEGLLLGAKQALGEDLEDAFRKTGIIHIVVLSGYNVMLVVAFVLFILSFFCSPRLRTIIGLVVITCFALAVGLSATVVRASIMAGLLLIAQAWGRTYDILRALLLAGAVMIFINPYLLLYDIGFQFSFMATLGLVLIAPTFEKALVSRVKIGIKEYVVATIATQIAVLPLLMYYIGEVSLVAVAVNLLVLPMVPIAMLLTFAAGMLALVSTALAVPIAFLSYLSLSYIIYIATWFAKIPFATVIVPPVSVTAVGIMYAGIAVLVWWFSKRQPGENEMSDWTVEEEGEIKAAGSIHEPAASTETPIFFR